MRTIFPIWIRPILLASLWAGLFAPVLTATGTEYTALSLGLGWAYDINSARTVVLTSYSGSLQRAFIYRDGAMTDLGALPGLDSSAGFAINEADNIVGFSFSSSGTSYSRAFRYKIDTMADVGTLEFGSFAYDINNAGVIVGESAKNEGILSSHAFVALGGVLTDLGTLGGQNSAATGINNAGTIVGWADTTNGLTHAFVHSGTMLDLGTLGGDYSYAADINDAGQVVGMSYLPSGSQHAFLFSGGVMTDLTPGAGNSSAKAINSAGVVVGNYNGRAFVYENGSLTDLSPLLTSIGIVGFSAALGINDQGDIVGYGWGEAGREIAFLLVVPEPSAAALLIVAGSVFCLRRRRGEHR